jgi:hypothetical protein
VGSRFRQILMFQKPSIFCHVDYVMRYGFSARKLDCYGHPHGLCKCTKTTEGCLSVSKDGWTVCGASGKTNLVLIMMG